MFDLLSVASPRTKKPGRRARGVRSQLQQPPSGRRRLAHLKSDEATDGNLVTQLFGYSAEVFPDRDFGILFHKTLVEQAVALKEFVELAFDDFGDGLRRLAFDLFHGDLLFLRYDGRINLIA